MADQPVHIRRASTGRTVQIPLARVSGEVHNFSVPAHMAPGAEHVDIQYEIDDSGGLLSEGRLEVFRRRDNRRLGGRDLAANELTHGAHTISWDGGLFTGSGNDSEFPDGYITCEHSPYIVRITVSADAHGISAGGQGEGDVAVEATSIALELGPASLCPSDKDRVARSELGSLPAPGHTGKVKLKSNLFKTNVAEMGSFDSDTNTDQPNETSFTQYRDDRWYGWGDGPQLPILAAVKFRTSTGSEALAPYAWGNRKVLFDFEEVDEDTSGLNATARTFIDQARNYHRTATTPNGNGCHADRGGKRGGTARFFPLPQGSFPSTVTAATNHAWTAFSTVSQTDPTRGKAAALFQPSRTAGDGYKVRALFDATRDLDPAGADPNAALVAESGTLRVWRRVEVARILKKKSDTPQFDFDYFKSYFRDAYIDLTMPSSTDVFDAASYNAHFPHAVETAISEAWWREIWIDSSVDQWNAGGFAVTFRDFDAFKAAAVEKRRLELVADNHLFEGEVGRRSAADWVERVLTSRHLNSAQQHADHADVYAYNIAIAVTRMFMGRGDGLSMFEFNHFSSVHDQANSSTAGMAGDYGSGRYKAGFICATEPPATPVHYVEATAAHEIGHHLFLCHAPLPQHAGDSWPPGAEPSAHDAADTTCAMGYQYDAYHFCGLCNLRLRGWRHTQLHSAGPSNSAA